MSADLNEARDANVSDESAVDSSSQHNAANKGWEKVRRKVMSIVGASCNFHTLRDMYGEIVLEPAKLKLVKTIASTAGQND